MSILLVKGADRTVSELLGDDFDDIPASVIFVDMKPGQGPKLHKHPYAELFFIIEGQARFTDGDHDYLLSAGDFAIAPPDQPHGFVNAGEGVLRQIDVHLNPRFATEWL